MALQVWLPLNGNFNNYGVSSVSGITGTNTSFVDGKIGKCCKMGYTSDFTIPAFDKAKQISIAYWCKVNTATSSQWLDMFHFKASDGTNTYWCRQELYSNCTLSGYFADAGGSISGMGCTVGEWIHYAITLNFATGEAKFYKNGTLFGQNTNINTSYYILSTNFRLGENGLDLSENDFRIYDHCLSVKEVREIAKGLVCHYALDNNGSGMPNYFLNSNFATGTTANWGGVNSSSISIVTKDGRKCLTGTKGTTNYLVCQSLSGYSYTANDQINFTISADVYVEAAGTITIGNWISTTQASGWQGMTFGETWHTSNSLSIGWNHVSVTHTNTKNQYSGTIITAFAYSAATFWITNLKFEFGNNETPWIPNSADASYAVFNINGNKEIDISGYGNHGTKSSDLTFNSDTARYSVSTVFDNNADTITVTPCFAVSQVMSEISVAIWFKTNTLNSTAPNWFSLGENSFFRARIASATSVWCYYRLSSASAAIGQKSYTFASKTLTDNIWHQVVCTFKDGVSKCYIDGSIIGTLDESATGKFLMCSSAGSTWHLAGYGANSENFIGSLSDFRIYATALSADDIAELYRASAEIDSNGTMYASDFTEV